MQNEVSSRSRLFAAARRLFAEHGYEYTSTSSIAREAGTSESQLIKHFGGKAALLDAIFVDGWNALRPGIEAQLMETASAELRLRAIPRLFVEALHGQPELRLLLLLEGRRMRREGARTVLVDGFSGFAAMLKETLGEMQKSGDLRGLVRPESVCAALIGLTENVIRDAALSERSGNPPEFLVADIGCLTDAVVDLVHARPAHYAAG